MTNKEILINAMRKVCPNAKDIQIIELLNIIRVDVYCIEIEFPQISVPYQYIIFSHDFAKAFWGEKEHYITDTDDKHCLHCNGNPCETDTYYCWQYYIQQMVLEEEPLKYLEQFL